MKSYKKGKAGLIEVEMQNYHIVEDFLSGESKSNLFEKLLSSSFYLFRTDTSILTIVVLPHNMKTVIRALDKYDEVYRYNIINNIEV